MEYSALNLKSPVNKKNAEIFSTKALAIKVVLFVIWWSALANEKLLTEVTEVTDISYHNDIELLRMAKLAKVLTTNKQKEAKWISARMLWAPKKWTCLSLFDVRKNDVRVSLMSDLVNLAMVILGTTFCVR